MFLFNNNNQTVDDGVAHSQFTIPCYLVEPIFDRKSDCFVIERRELCCHLANADERLNQMRATLATTKLPPYRDL